MTIKSHVKMSVSGIISRTTEYCYKEDFVFRIKNNDSSIVNSNTKLFRILAIFNGLKGDAFRLDRFARVGETERRVDVERPCGKKSGITYARACRRRDGRTSVRTNERNERTDSPREPRVEREERDCGKAGSGVGCHCNGVCHGPHVPTTPTAEPFATLLLNTLKRANRSRELNS